MSRRRWVHAGYLGAPTRDGRIIETVSLEVGGRNVLLLDEDGGILDQITGLRVSTQTWTTSPVNRQAVFIETGARWSDDLFPSVQLVDVDVRGRCDCACGEVRLTGRIGGATLSPVEDWPWKEPRLAWQLHEWLPPAWRPSPEWLARQDIDRATMLADIDAADEDD